MGYVVEGTAMNNYAHIFDLLLRLRQAVDHPYLVLYAKKKVQDDPFLYCSLCHEPIEDPVESKCKHIFCRMCVENYLQQNEENTKIVCPICQRPLIINLVWK
jgi:DNA repair protein RAD16